jgi:hypothetical protein
MNRWLRVPDGLDLVQAAALPVTVDTGFPKIGLRAGPDNDPNRYLVRVDLPP